MQSLGTNYNESIWFPWSKFSRPQKIILVGYFLIYLSIRLILRMGPYFGDDFFTVQEFNNDFFTFISRAIPEAEFHFPPAFVMLYVMNYLFGSSNPFIVSFPFLVVTCVFYWMLATINWRKILRLEKQLSESLGGWINVIACILISYNQTHQIHSLELRPYATLSLLCFLSLLLVWSAALQSKFNFKHLVGILCISFFHNFGLLMIGLSIIYVMLDHFMRRDKKSGWRPLIRRLTPLFQIASLGLFISIIGVAWYISYASMYKKSPTPGTFVVANYNVDFHLYIKSGWAGVKQVIALYYGFVGHGKMVRSLFVVTLFFGSVLLLIRKCWNALFFPLVFVVLATSILYVGTFGLRYWFIQRIFVWVMPFWAVYNGACAVICYEAIQRQLSKKKVAQKIQ